MRKKRNSCGNDLKIASFRKKRYNQVRLYALGTTKLFESSVLRNSQLLAPNLLKDQGLAIKKLYKVLWFDQAKYRLFLDKYAEFVSITLNLDIRIELDHIISEYELRAMAKSPTEALNFFKKIYGTSCRIAASSKFEVPTWTAVNRRGEPRVLGPLLPLLHGTVNERRAALSAIKVLELIVVDGGYSTENLTKEWIVPNLEFGEHVGVGNYFKRAYEIIGGDKHGVDLQRLLACYKQALETSFPSRERESRIESVSRKCEKHFSGRNGPNGPCLSTIVLDYCALVKNESGRRLMMSIKEFAERTANQQLLKTIQMFDEDDLKVVSNERGELITPIHSKISCKQESWGRMRLFAIADWFSHSALRGYRNTLCEWLAAQPQDGTFDQDSVVEQIRLWTIDPSSGTEPESTDLTAATDSIPVEVQQEIASVIMNNGLAALWRSICTDRTFKGPNGEDLRYAMGQPMGISSSWESMAVWNHIMCRTANLYVHGLDFDLKQAKYGVVGDDVTLQGTRVNFIYKFLVSTLQGVGISPLKGYHYDNQQQGNRLPNIKDGSPMVAAEFCKRIFCSGDEITPIPPDEVYTSFADSTQFPELLFSLQRRGYPELTVAVVPRLTNMSKDRKLALLLSSNPLRMAPPFTEGDYLDLSETSPFNTVAWFIPGVDKEKLYKSLLRAVKKTVTKSMQRSSGSLRLWSEAATGPAEKIVKSWHYTSTAQSCEMESLITITREKIIKYLEGCDTPSFFPTFDSPSGPSEWNDLRKQLKGMQLLFDVATLYGEGTYTKKDTKSMFENNFLAKVTREFIRELPTL
jgi:hypothetical protein